MGGLRCYYSRMPDSGRLAVAVMTLYFRPPQVLTSKDAAHSELLYDFDAARKQPSPAVEVLCENGALLCG